MNVEFQIHGVLATGQSVWKQDDMDYYKTFYAQRAENTLMTVEALRRPHGLCTYYSYLRSNNVVSAREGSYFGMTVRIDGAFCTDVRGMYDILDNLFEKMVVGKILLPIEGGRLKFAVDRFEDLSDYLTQLEQNFFGMYNAFFAISDFISLTSASLSNRYKVNPIDITLTLVRQLFNQHLKIGVSPEIVPLSAQESIRKAHADIERERQQLLSGVNERTEEITNLRTEIDRLRQDNQRLTNHAQSSNLDGEINEMLRQIGKPISRLSKVICDRFPEEISNEKKEDKGLNTLLLWAILALIIIMNLFGVKSCNSNQVLPQQASAQNVRDTTSTATYGRVGQAVATSPLVDIEEDPVVEVPIIDFKGVWPDIAPNANLKIGNSYTLSLTKNRLPFNIEGEGMWQYKYDDVVVKLDTYENIAQLYVTDNSLKNKSIQIEFLYNDSVVVVRKPIIIQ